jgi:hypothetical protein
MADIVLLAEGRAAIVSLFQEESNQTHHPSAVASFDLAVLVLAVE